MVTRRQFLQLRRGPSEAFMLGCVTTPSNIDWAYEEQRTRKGMAEYDSMPRELRDALKHLGVDLDTPGVALLLIKVHHNCGIKRLIAYIEEVADLKYDPVERREK